MYHNEIVKLFLLSTFFISIMSNHVLAKNPPKIIPKTLNTSKKEVLPTKPEDIILNSKDDIEKVFEIGVKLYETQKYEDAIKVFNKITEKFSGYGNAHYYIGLSYFSLGNYYKSIGAFLEANRIFDNTKMDAMFGAGLAYLSSGYEEEARLALQKVIKESKDKELIEDAQTWLSSIDEQVLQKAKVELLTSDLKFREGVGYLDIQDYTKAEASFRKCVSNKPNSALPLYYLGNTLYLRENYKEAIQTFEKVIIIDPNSKIAKDSKLYIRVIEDIEASSEYSKPFSFQLSSGFNYDSNLSYSDKSEVIMGDISGILNFSAEYNGYNNLSMGYNYYTYAFSGINDKTQNLPFHSYDFNLQKHSANIKANYNLSNNLLSELDVSGNWYLLGGNSFLLNGRISPRAYFYLNPNFVTVIQYFFDINSYSVFKTRNSLDHALDISQYIHFLDNSMWVRLGYNFKKVNANDQVLTQSGILTDGNKYDLSYNFTNSLIENNFIFNYGFNTLPFNAKLKLESKISLNNYDNNDIYTITSPTINIATSKKEDKIIKDVKKKREDILYSLGANLSFPLYQNLSASLFYTYTNNISNITEKDYSSRSYNKHFAGINLNFDF